MAISNYTELQTAVGKWLHHTGVSSEIVDFITMAESRINRDIRVREMEAESDLTVTSGSRFLPLPTGFVEPIALYLTRSGDVDRWPLGKWPAEILDISTVSGEPNEWAMDGDEITMNCPFDSTGYTMTLRYLKAWDIATDTTNWLLTNHPDVYLWSACMEGTLYLRDEARFQLYENRYLTARKELINQSRRNRKSNLKSEIPVGKNSFQITRGY